MAGIGFHPKESSRWAPAVFSGNRNPPPGLRTRGNPPQAGQATPPVPTPGSEAGRRPGFGARGHLPFGSNLCRAGVGGALTLSAPRAPAPFSEPAAHPPEKLSWRRVARGGGAPGASGGLSTPGRPLRSNSLGYREIFISRRPAPVATEAAHAATVGKPRRPRDKDSSVTRLDPASQGQPPARRIWAETATGAVRRRGRGPPSSLQGCWRPRKTIERASSEKGRRGGKKKGSILTPRRLLRILTYPCFTMSLKLEAIPGSRRPPSPKRAHPRWLRGGSRAGSGGGVGGGAGGGKVDPAKLRRRRLGVASAGAHHSVPQAPKVGGRLAATSGERGERSAARRGWSAGVS